MPDSKPSGTNKLVQTIQRMSSILETLGQSPQGISIRDLSAELKLPKGTIHRLLASLAYFGYVRQDSKTKNYSLGLKLLELGNILLGQLDLRKVAEPYLRNLGEKTKETVHLVILDQKEVVYIEKVEMDQKPSGLRMASRVGGRNPAHSCAVGKVLLAYLPREEVESLIKEKGLPRRTENTITDPGQLQEILQAVRKQGFAIDDEENEQGIRCVAAPVLNEAGKVAAAVSISGPSFRVSRRMVQEKLKKEVMETALQISERLGYRRK
jgi:IclR family KDG regulon transcriptional repressor